MPPPPSEGPKIAPPAGMPPVKVYPISVGVPQPSCMSIPGLETAAAADPQEGGGGGGAAEEQDDGFTPEERRKMQLEQDPGFKKFSMMLRMKVPLFQIRQQIRAGGVY